jgi:hypothetical protein
MGGEYPGGGDRVPDSAGVDGVAEEGVGALDEVGGGFPGPAGGADAAGFAEDDRLIGGGELFGPVGGGVGFVFVDDGEEDGLRAAVGGWVGEAESELDAFFGLPALGGRVGVA